MNIMLGVFIAAIVIAAIILFVKFIKEFKKSNETSRKKLQQMGNGKN